jgi:hypothetical protein
VYCSFDRIVFKDLYVGSLSLLIGGGGGGGWCYYRWVVGLLIGINDVR